MRTSRLLLRQCRSKSGLYFDKVGVRRLTAKTRNDGDTSQQPPSRTRDTATRKIVDDFAVIKEKYATPKYPIVLAHGLLGFDELHLLGPRLRGWLPGVPYWRGGIAEALAAHGVHVLTASVGPLDPIEERAATLAAYIEAHVPAGQPVNVVAHSMGGLDARYMISRLQRQQKQQQQEDGMTPAVEGKNSSSSSSSSPHRGRRLFDIDVRSLTTVATPHRGSAFADHVAEWFGSGPDGGRGRGRVMLPLAREAVAIIGKGVGWRQLTREHMCEEFNASVPDVAGVRYFSYGASFSPAPWNVFRYPGRVVAEAEGGANDGLVSVASSRWGDYRGTLAGVSHLDLINWSGNGGRLRWLLARALTGRRRTFNAVALYLGIADMLAKEGL